MSFEPNVGGLKLVELVTGDEAVKAIDKLHGMPINVVRGFIAHYKGAQDKATIWVSEADSDELARKQLELMIGKMKHSGRSPFSHYREFASNGLKIIGFDGMGQVHYVFRDDKWVYWISADSGRIDRFLAYLLRGQ